MSAFSPSLQKAGAQTTQTPWQNLTQSQLSAVWWEFSLSVPVSISPWFDDTGAKAANGQPYFSAPGGAGNLLFLVGTVNVSGTVTRSISVKQGTALFFPVINNEWDNVLGTPHLGGTTPAGPVYGVPELRAIAAGPIDSAGGLYSSVTPTDKSFKKATGATISLDYPRLLSPPFSYTLPATDNLYQYFGVNISGTVGPAVSDGYWSFIPGTGANSLAPGYYVLQFGGSQGNGFTEAITYHITVTP